eukprot:9469309-Pyramimonas_sp.AAC.2
MSHDGPNAAAPNVQCSVPCMMIRRAKTAVRISVVPASCLLPQLQLDHPSSLLFTFPTSNLQPLGQRSTCPSPRLRRR